MAAHVALTPRSPGLGTILRRGLRARGDFDGLNRDMAREHALQPPAITTLDNLLFDVLVHVQDVAVPLGVTHPMPLDAAREGAERVWRMGWPFWAKRRMRGLRLVATDVTWSAGAGEEIHAPVQSLLLLLTGRTTAALPHLSGPGTNRLADSLISRPGMMSSDET